MHATVMTSESSSFFGSGSGLSEGGASSSTLHSQVPRLSDLCRRVLKANVAHLVDVGDVPYSMIRDILPGCRVEQLREIEELSPHIAEEDEEIWEYFFKRDFPIVAEARAKVAKEREASDKGKQTSSSLSQPPPKARQSPREFHEKSYSQDTGMEEDEDEDDDLFMSYRDLYYDEQVRREEKLASAGERLKERMNNLAQMKSSRQTILDPRLSLNLRKRRRGQTLPTGRHHWSKESRPKTLTEKARARASQLAFAYDPPRFTRSASMKVGFIPQKPKPVYKESSLEDVQPSQATTKGIFGPRRGKPSLEACQAANEAFSRKGSNAHAKATSFIERTVTRPIKSSVDRPYKLLELPTHGIPGNSVTKTATPPRSAQNHIQPITRAPIQAAPASSSEVQIPRPTINIPGITRRPILQKKGSEHGQTLAPTDTSVSPAGSPPLSTAIASSPPPPASTSSLSSTPVPNLPMMSQPRKVPSGPSLFIPRKRAK